MKQLITTLPTKVHLDPLDRVQVVGASLTQLDDDFSLMIDVINASNFEATNFTFAVKFCDSFGKYLFDGAVFDFSSPDTKLPPHSLHYFDPFVLDERFHTARQVEIRVKSVSFGDKTEAVYEKNAQTSYDLPLIDLDKQAQMKKYIAPDCITYGENLRTAWRCVCGTTNMRAEFECGNCHRNKFYVLNQLTEPLINQKIAAALDPSTPLEDPEEAKPTQDHIPQTTQVIQKLRGQTMDLENRTLKDYLLLFGLLVLIIVSLFFSYQFYQGSGLYRSRQVKKAEQLITQGEFTQAKEVYRSLEANPPEDLALRQEKLDALIQSQVHFEMGSSAMSRNDPFVALNYFSKVLKEDKVRYTQAHQNIAKLEHQVLTEAKTFLREGQIDQGVDLVHRLLDILPNSADGLNLLDQILNRENISKSQRARLNEIKKQEENQEQMKKPLSSADEKRAKLTEKAQALLHSYQTVQESSANLREAPSLDAKILQVLPKDTAIYIYETSIEKTDRIWCRVQAQTPDEAMYEGWLSSRVLESE